MATDQRTPITNGVREDERAYRQAPRDAYGFWCCPDCFCHSHARITSARSCLPRKSRREDLVRAAALLIAEVERLDRIEARGK